jgi:hypothetical protein
MERGKRESGRLTDPIGDRREAEKRERERRKKYKDSWT